MMPALRSGQARLGSLIVGAVVLAAIAAPVSYTHLRAHET